MHTVQSFPFHHHTVATAKHATAKYVAPAWESPSRFLNCHVCGIKEQGNGISFNGTIHGILLCASYTGALTTVKTSHVKMNHMEWNIFCRSIPGIMQRYLHVIT